MEKPVLFLGRYYVAFTPEEIEALKLKAKKCNTRKRKGEDYEEIIAARAALLAYFLSEGWSPHFSFSKSSLVNVKSRKDLLKDHSILLEFARQRNIEAREKRLGGFDSFMSSSAKRPSH